MPIDPLPPNRTEWTFIPYDPLADGYVPGPAAGAGRPEGLPLAPVSSSSTGAQAARPRAALPWIHLTAASFTAARETGQAPMPSLVPLPVALAVPEPAPMLPIGDARLGGAEVERASVHKLEAACRDADASGRPFWQALVRALQEDRFTSFPDHLSADGVLRFGCEGVTAGGRPCALGLHAERKPDARLKLVQALFIDTESQRSITQPLDDDSVVNGRLRALHELAMPIGDMTARSYVALAHILDAWMRISGRGRLPDLAVDQEATLSAFTEHVGQQSYAGRHAISLFRALEGSGVQPIEEPAGDPLGLSPRERATVLSRRHGDMALEFAEQNWNSLLERLNREQVLRVARFGTRPALFAVIQFAPQLMKPVEDGGRGLTPQQITDIAAHPGGGEALAALQRLGPELMKPAHEGGLGLSTSQFHQVASNDAGRQILKSLADNGASLVRPVDEGGLGLSTPQVLDIAARQGGAPTLNALPAIGRRLMRPQAEGGLGLSPGRLARIASARNSKPKLEALEATAPALLAAGASLDQLEAMASHRDSGPALRAVAGKVPDVLSGRITLEALVAAASRSYHAVSEIDRL